MDSIGAETTYPAFWIFPTSHTDDYRTYQAPEDVLAKVFQDDFEEPQKQTIQGVDIYLARYIGAPTEKEIQVVKALLFHNNQYIIFDAVGLTSETDRLYTMAEAMLNSLRIEEN